MTYKYLDIEEYNGLPVIKKYNPFDRHILDKIYKLFRYAQETKEFQGRLVRFDFDETPKTKDIKSFFERVRKHHRRMKKPFLYLCVIEESKEKGIHHHAFVIVHYQNYGTRKMVFNMLNRFWNKENDSEISDIWPSHRLHHNKYKNFYSISTDPKATKGELEEAFRAASYLAKTTQIPKHLPKGTRRLMSSKIIKKSS